MQNWRETIWVTARKERIRICDMEDDHLLNSISFLERRMREIAKQEPNWEDFGRLELLLAEKLYRGLSGGTVRKFGKGIIVDLRSGLPDTALAPPLKRLLQPQ